MAGNKPQFRCDPNLMRVLEIFDVIGVPILVALIAVAPAVIGITRFRKENNHQHNETAVAFTLLMSGISQVDDKISKVETKVDRHMGEHDAVLSRVAQKRRSNIK